MSSTLILTIFTFLLFLWQDCLQQLDSSSCGPLVVAPATERMLNREVFNTRGIELESALQMRKNGLSLIREAWEEEFIVLVKPIAKGIWR
ncbi:hypothetical protein F5Y09DRAFT_248506 [Xylaria sp. FL1042]|nr:hypothetical protein F5Y09DRAFT_248506 [Xylaria sp. FL1042]